MATENKGPMIVAVCWVFTSISLLFVAARVFVRTVVHRRLYGDDFWIIFASACAIVANVLTTISVRWGNGQHFSELTLEQKQNTIKYMMSSYVVGIETLGLPKLGIVVLLTKLLSPGRLHRTVLWTMAVICCLSLTAMVTTLLLQCTPPRALWTLSLERNCLKPRILIGLAFWASTFSAFLDFYLAVYPGIVLSKLRMPLPKKIALCFALGFGIVSGCVGIVKATGVPSLSSSDVSYDLCDPLYWTNIEGSMIIIAACIPVLQPIVEMCKGKKIWSTKKSSSSGNRRHYENVSKKSGGRNKGDKSSEGFEMNATIGGTQLTRKKVDVYGFTINGRDDSEESIVQPGGAHDGRTASTSDGGSANAQHGPNQNQDGHILHSTTFAVSYDDQAAPVSASTRWTAV